MPVVRLGSASRVAAATAGPDLSLLAKNNPKFGEVLKKTPGLMQFLGKSTVSEGPRGNGSSTRVEWTWWNHSQATGKKYGHSLSDDQIRSDTIVVFQPTSKPGAQVTFGGRSFPGNEIVAVFNVGDQITGVSSYDGGFLGRMTFEAHGQAGEKATLAWAVVSIAPDGQVRGGGFPTTSGGVPVPYQQNKHGSEYHGRAAEIVHGSPAFVPITDQ